jgi:tetratricopeptide (TPR) repeat protein
VFRARDRLLNNEELALKVLRPERAAERSWIRRLAREVKVARAIRNPNVCRIFELGHDGGHWFITMELAEGGTLREELDRREAQVRPGIRRTFPDPDWLRRLADAQAVCSGLAAIHAVGIAHRDVTPHNVLRMRDGRLVISDFGLAVAAAESTTFVGGTPRYMAPEVLAGGRGDQRSDVYQLGLLLHEVAFGRRPEWVLHGERETLRPPVGDDAAPGEEEVAAVCAECLARNPAARPPSAIAVAGRLASAERARPRGWTARTLGRARRLARRPGARMAVAAVALIAAVIAVGRVALRPRLCQGGAGRAAAAWGAARREAMHRAFLATGHTHAQEAFAIASSLLDDQIARWVAAYTDACQATHVRGEQSPEVLDLRMACLNEDLDAVGALAHVFSEADSAVVDHAVEAASSLDDLARCADVRQLRNGVKMPADPAVREAVDELRPELNRAAALFEALQYEKALKVAAQVIPAAERVGYKPLLAEALAVAGDASTDFDVGVARSYFERAVVTAESCGHDRVVARAAAELVFVNCRTDWGAAERWATLADAALQRIGGDARIQSWLLNNVSVLRSIQGRPEDARQAAEKSVTLKSSILGGDHLDVAISLGNLAEALQALDRIDEGLEVTGRALRILQRWLGPDHLRMASPLNNEGEMLFAKGRVDESEHDFQRALRILTAQLPADHVNASWPMVGLAKVALVRGDTMGAIPLLEKAVAMRERSGAPPEVAESRFQLARALDQAHRDEARARALAEQAATAYGQSPAFARQKREVDAWLAGRAARPARSARPAPRR